MKYILGITNDKYESIKNADAIVIGIYFIQEHRNLFIDDFVDLIYGELVASYKINSIKYSSKLEAGIQLLDTKDGAYFTILELERVYGK